MFFDITTTRTAAFFEINHQIEQFVPDH